MKKLFITILLIFLKQINAKPTSTVILPEPEKVVSDEKVNGLDQSNEFQGKTSYKEAGCFKDNEMRAIPLLEGSDPDLSDFYKTRPDPVVKCADVARKRGYQLFAIQNGGMCLAGTNAHKTYKMYGTAKNCKDGKGGPWANDVYIFNDFPLQLFIFTGKLPKSGTDSNVHVTLSGSMGTSREIALTADSDNENPFESGQKDIFYVHTIPLGILQRITIGHDDSGQQSSGWYLEKVVVKDQANNLYKFDVNRWLATDEDDGQIERELSLTSIISPGLYRPLGCFKERRNMNEDRAIPSMEGHDEILNGQGEAAYNGREFPIEKCADVARRRHYVMFAIQDGGLCASSNEIQNTYDKYGTADDCVVNGTGSQFSTSVYVFADQEPGFQDAEDATGGKDTNSNEDSSLPSDPAMQVWRKPNGENPDGASTSVGTTPTPTDTTVDSNDPQVFKIEPEKRLPEQYTSEGKKAFHQNPGKRVVDKKTKNDKEFTKLLNKKKHFIAYS